MRKAKVHLDAFDLPDPDLALQEDKEGRLKTRRYCCERHCWRVVNRLADIAESHRDIAERDFGPDHVPAPATAGQQTGAAVFCPAFQNASRWFHVVKAFLE